MIATTFAFIIGRRMRRSVSVPIAAIASIEPATAAAGGKPALESE